MLNQPLLIQNIFTGQNIKESMMDGFVENYMGFEQLETYLISLFAALFLATIIAFQPQTFGKKEDINSRTFFSRASTRRE